MTDPIQEMSDRRAAGANAMFANLMAVVEGDATTSSLAIAPDPTGTAPLPPSPPRDPAKHW